MKRKRWSNESMLAWTKTYLEYKEGHGALHFNNYSGYLRCKAEAEKGIEASVRMWAIFMKHRIAP